MVSGHNEHPDSPEVTINATASVFYETGKARLLAIAQAGFVLLVLLPVTVWRVSQNGDWLVALLALILSAVILNLSRHLWMRGKESRPVLLLSSEGFASPAAGLDWQSWDLVTHVDLGRRAVIFRFQDSLETEVVQARQALSSLFGFMVWFRWRVTDVELMFMLLKGGRLDILRHISEMAPDKLSPRAKGMLQMRDKS